MESKEIVDYFLGHSILLSVDVKDSLFELKGFFEGQKPAEDKEFIYLNKDIKRILKQSNNIDINWLEFEKTKTIFEKTGDDKHYKRFLNYIHENITSGAKEKTLRIISSYEELSSKKDVQDFAMYFNTRLEALQKILYSRSELKGVTSISRILNKNERENISLIGLIKDKKITKNNNIMLTLEDSTGQIKVLVNKNKPEIYDIAKDLVLDEAIGVAGVNGINIVFANNLLLPDIPVAHELKKSDEGGYALFLSDLHIGSDNFLSDDFDRFLSWINQKTGNEKQREIASKVKYIFIIGDLVDGVGVYPGQEKDLAIKDARMQYKACAELLSKIPSHIDIIICAGNHDAIRLAEPQPPLYNDFCKALHDLPNTTIVSNPSIVNIHSSKKFDGYNVLLYHGYSFDYYVANVDSIRNAGGYDRPDLIMRFLLKRRHLAPTHTSTLYVPYTDKDPLVIDPIPDFFVTGHIHKSAVSNYKNITLICGSCWQSKTAFQEKMGHHPEPGRVPVVNLSTREVKILRFGR